MATITSTPTGGTLTVNKNKEVKGTISWSKPTVPSGATISSCILTGKATASMSKGSVTITVNGTTVTSGSNFTINLGTANDTTSVNTSIKGGNNQASGSVSFSELLYTVTYTESVAKPTYTVTFKDWDGTTLKTQTVEEGSSATAPSNPTRYGYTFTGWDKTFNNITGDITVTAQYEIDRGGLTSDTTTLAIEYGVEKDLVINVDTLKISTSLSSIKIKNSQGDSSKTNTIFDWRLKSYSSTQNTVTFGITGTKNGTEIITVYDPNGNAELHITITVSGAPEEEPEVPTIPVDYSIALRPASVTQDSGYNNTWTNVENTYDTDTSTSGTIIVTGSSQSGFKRKYVDTIFNFDNAIPVDAIINSAVLTVRAKQSATTNLNMTVSVDDNEVISSTLLGQSSVNYTADVATIIKDLNQLNINLTSAATSNRTFTLYDVRIDVNYTVYEEIPEEPEVPENPIVYYTVTFKDYDGTVLSTQTIEEGYDAIAPADPTRDGYIFKGWSKSFTNVSSNLEVIALYESVIAPDEPEEPSTSSITNIKIGDTVLQNLYIGGLPITKIYIGDYILYEAVKKHSPAASIAPTKIEFDVETEVEFEGDGDYIDTKVDLFDDGNDWSFLIDFTDEGKAEWSDSLFILHNFFEGPDGELQGLNIQKTGEAQGTRLSFQVNDNFYATKQLSNGVNTRLVFTFKYPGELHMYYNDPDIDAYLGGNGHYKFTFNEYFDLDKCNLHLACWYNESQGGVGRFWRGIINEFIIWNKTALSDEQVQYVLQNKAKN